jgi:hypothetical protein
MHEIDLDDGLSDSARVRREIARVAAQLIADEGLDYGPAKAEAAATLGRHAHGRNLLPDNDEIDRALREHLELFDPQAQARLRAMREAALDLMEKLHPFRPYLTGAVWKGLAHEHAMIQVDLFADNGKEVHYSLLNAQHPFEAVDVGAGRGQPAREGFTLEAAGFPALLVLHPERQQHNQSKERGDIAAVQRLLAQTS